MSVSPVLFSSKRPDWETPSELFAELDAEFHFALDAAAFPSNAKCSRFLSPEDDALACSWAPGPVWLNPPYGGRTKALEKLWMPKVVEEHSAGVLVVCLLPSRTDTVWFQDFVLPFAEVRFLSGRLRFVGASSSAPFPSLIAVFRPEGLSEASRGIYRPREERPLERFRESVHVDSATCSRCGHRLEQRPRRRGSPRKFCSTGCRRKSWKAGRA